MEGSPFTYTLPESHQSATRLDERQRLPFAQETVTITKQDYIELRHRAHYWEAQHSRAKLQIEALKQELILKDAKIKELQNRLFGRKSEKNNPLKSEKGNKANNPSDRHRGQQPGSRGHGRTDRPNLPIVHEESDLPNEKKVCSRCGLPYQRNVALDETSDLIEVNVRAHLRRIRRKAYTRHPNCHCESAPTILTAPPPPRVIPRSDLDVSFWVEVILNKYRYAQPTHRYLQDLSDQGLPVSAGTVAGGLRALAPLFEPILEALYCQQMTEPFFHNDETRWQVFASIEGKVGTRWYLWVTRSSAVIFYCIDPSRSAAVPGAHFAGVQQDRVIIICDRYSAYKKLARLADNILLAFCWAHVRRDFLEAGRSLSELEPWALQCKEQIGTLYHLNRLRLEQWDSERSLEAQSEAFNQHHEALQLTLQHLHDEAVQGVTLDTAKVDNNVTVAHDGAPWSKTAQTKQQHVYQSLLEHWPGLTLFVEHPEIPMDNNRAENAIRTPVNGRKNYYGSGSIWSAQLAATLFSILQTLELWGINVRHWLTRYLNTCAENGGKAPRHLEPFLPWSMTEDTRDRLRQPYASQAPPIPPLESVSIQDSS